MSLTEAIAARQQGPATVEIPLEDLNDTNQAYAALVADRILLLERIDRLRAERRQAEDDNAVLAARCEMLDDIIEDLKAELFERNDAMVSIRTTLESQSIDF